VRGLAGPSANTGLRQPAMTATTSDIMKKIEAIIRPFKLEAVKDRLNEVDVHGITVSEVKGFGRSGGKAAVYPGAEYVVDFVPKAKLEIVVPEEKLEAVIDVIQRTAHTGKGGDGKIFVIPVEEAIRIRTGETGPMAL